MLRSNVRFFDTEEKKGGEADTLDPSKGDGDGKAKDLPDPKAAGTTDDGVELGFVTKTDDGQFEIKTENSVYKGATQKEVLDKFYEGAAKNDQFLREQKAKGAVRLPASLHADPDGGESELVVRSVSEIENEEAPKIIKMYGVDPEKLSWTPEQWRAYAREKDADEQPKREQFEVSREIDRVDRVRSEIHRRVGEIQADEARRYVTTNVIDDEHEAVLQAVADSGISDDTIGKQFDYEAILEAVLSKKENYNQHGSLRSGRIVDAVNRELKRLAKDPTESAIRKKIEGDIAAGDGKKKEVPSGAHGGPHSPKAKAYGSMEDALDAAKKEHHLT